MSSPTSALSPAVAAQPPSANASSITTRYIDAYRVAKFQTGLGTTIKIVAAIGGGLISLISTALLLYSMIPQQSMFGQSANIAGVGLGVVGMFAGLVVAGVGFVMGIMMSSQGQILKAALDSAVNSSPFVDNRQRAQMMSISGPS